MTWAPRRILVGFDGSSGARDALALARDLAPGAKAIVVHVPPHEDPLAHRYRLVENADTVVPSGFFDAAIRDLSGMDVETRCYAGASPAHVLCDLTEKEDLDLVVVGSPHRGAIGRALIGSVADALVHGGRAPIVLAPRGYGEGGHAAPRTIAVAYDTTPDSDAALRHAESLALSCGASLEVLTVVAAPAVASDALVESHSARLEPYMLVETAIKTLDKSLEVRARRLTGPIADAIADACAEDDIDLLVTGSRDYGPLRRALAGSVSTRLIHIAPCPVLLVPRVSRSSGAESVRPTQG